ncbi:hypothetical protein BJY04DRAFT_75818 [Aspergillus karnatakaensis]|uniref:uncharacterized protein n=1 Tax=Aspergillus karnatakaensis TaxID=1810916 RepID=UPI003CCD5193
MAPRRGGGGGGGSSSISCDSSAFALDSPRIDIAFQSLFLLATIILYFIAQSRISRGKKEGFSVPGKALLILSVLFAVFAFILAIVITALTQCSPGVTDDIMPASVVQSWLSQFALYILNLLLLLTVPKKYATEFPGSVSRPAILFQQSWAAFMGVLLVAGLSIETALQVYLYSDSYSDYEKVDELAEPLRGVWTTSSVINVVGVLVATATVGAASRAAQGVKTLSTWTPVFSISTLAFNLAVLGGYVDRAFDNLNNYSLGDFAEYERKRHAAYFLTWFFFCLAFFAALKVLSHRGASGYPSVPAGVAAGGPVSQNPVYVPPQNQSGSWVDRFQHPHQTQQMQQQQQGGFQYQNQFGGQQTQQYAYGGGNVR